MRKRFDTMCPDSIDNVGGDVIGAGVSGSGNIIGKNFRIEGNVI